MPAGLPPTGMHVIVVVFILLLVLTDTHTYFAWLY
jgi:hypothetical protein